VSSLQSGSRVDGQGQRCKACGQRDKFDFHVPDEIWAAAVPPDLRSRVVCLACFDRFARERNVQYAGSIRTLHFAGDQAAMVFRLVSAAPVRG
jgi:hypothetical protein